MNRDLRREGGGREEGREGGREGGREALPSFPARTLESRCTAAFEEE